MGIDAVVERIVEAVEEVGPPVSGARKRRLRRDIMLILEAKRREVISPN